MKNLGILVSLMIAVVAKLQVVNEKPFGVGHGPSFLGGSEAGQDRTNLAFDVYNQFINYKGIIGELSMDEKVYHSRWTAKDYCLGACPRYSYCKDGLCVCNHEQSMVQLYGQCHGNDTLHLVGDKSKYRKPDPRPRPEWCFCYGRCGGREVCQNLKEREQCKATIYPNLFDHNSQFCRRGDHDHCKSKDINMICGDKKMMDWRDRMEKNVCECRKGMEFDTKSMECRIFIDVDCADEAKTELSADILKEKFEKPDREYSKAEAKNMLCNLMDSVAEEYAVAWNPSNLETNSSLIVLDPEDSFILLINVLGNHLRRAMGYCPDTPFVEFWKDFLKFWKDFLKFCFPNSRSYYREFEYMLRDPPHFLFRMNGMWLDFEEYLVVERHWWDPLVSDLVFVFEDFEILYDIIAYADFWHVF